MTAKRLGRWSIGLPLGTLCAFLTFWRAADANGWFGRHGSDFAAATFAGLLFALALSAIAGFVLSLMAWSAARREGERAWPRLIPGVIVGAIVGLFFALMLWALVSSIGRFR